MKQFVVERDHLRSYSSEPVPQDTGGPRDTGLLALPKSQHQVFQIGLNSPFCSNLSPGGEGFCSEYNTQPSCQSQGKEKQWMVQRGALLHPDIPVG